MKRILSFILAAILLMSMIPARGILVYAEATYVKLVGDLDQDGEITDWDGVLLARHLAGWSVTVADEKVLDIDGDGEITDWDGVMFDRHLAGWSVATQVGKSLTYSITYTNTMGAVNTNPTSYENGGTAIQLSSISAEHYTFAGWYIGDNKVTDIPTDGEGDLTITARWTPVEYTIAYADTKGAANSNPAAYHIESDTTVLQNLTCDGYVFDGWYQGNQKVTEITTGSTGNITLTAKWTACDYTITYENTKGAINNNPNGFSTDSSTITLTDLEKEGYSFDGWYNGNTKVTTIPSGTIGNITLNAQWTPVSYTATFTADGSVVATRYFTIEDETISNIPNVPSKAGYTGAWSNYSLGATNVVIPAVYTLNEYSITYANTKGADNSNLANYTVITNTFNLSDLQNDGYEFIGWYKGNTKVTSIEKGTTGNITLTAKWSAVDYVITYTDTKGAFNANPVEYNVETGTIYLTNLVAEHYTFDGWYWNGRKVASIPAGNIGDIELVARWTPVSYNLTYQDTKGATNTNPATYTVEDMIILQNLSADGYTFEGWYIGDERVTTIPVGSSGNKMLTAKWTAITYSITYQDSKNLEHNGPDTYTVESNTILLPNLSATGYTFDGWYNGNKKVTSIQAGSTGDLVLTAKWSIITYTITYQDTKDQTNNNPISYTIEDEIVFSDIQLTSFPSRLGYVFEGWYNGEEKITEIRAGSHSNLVLTAKWTPFVYTIMYFNMEGAENPNTLPATTTIETWQGDYELLTPSRDGYNFVQWEIVDRTGAGRFPITTLTWARIKYYALHSDGSVALNAKWTPIEYKINYVSNIDVEITNPNPAVYTAANSIILADASSDYFTFKGWYADADFKTPVTTLERGTFGDITLYAKWEFNGTYISSAEDFANIVYDMSGSYMLSRSITISVPLGDKTNPFTGYFCGNGYWIYGSEVFSVNEGTISQVNTEKLLCGANGGTIVNCSSQGGIARINTGTISLCKSTGFVTQSSKTDVFYGTNSNGTKETGYQYATQYIGGLVAYNSGTISQCFATKYSMNITINKGDTAIVILRGYIGGLVGYSTGDIYDSYYSGTTIVATCNNSSNFVNSSYGTNWGSNKSATAYLYCGGFVGYSSGNITGCYANVTSISGKVNGNGWSAENKHYGAAYGYLGGFAGYAKNVANSFSSVESLIYDTSNADDLCSYLRRIGISLADYYNTNDFTTLYYNSNCSLSTIGIYGSRTIGTATSATNFKSRNFIMNTFGWSDDVWTLTNGSLPKLKWE